MVYRIANSPAAEEYLRPAGENLTPKHLISTILHTVFDVGRLRLVPELAAVARLAEHAPLPV